MSEEEKKAIEEVKSYIEWVKDRGTNTDKHIEILLNYIDKLQKENENALILIEQYSNEIEKILKGEFISKDKICEIIDKRIDYCCTYDEMYTTALEDFKEIIEKGDIE